MGQTDLEQVARSELGVSQGVAELKRLGPKTLRLAPSFSFNVDSSALIGALTSLQACRRHVRLAPSQLWFQSRS